MYSMDAKILDKDQTLDLQISNLDESPLKHTLITLKNNIETNASIKAEVDSQEDKNKVGILEMAIEARHNLTLVGIVRFREGKTRSLLSRHRRQSLQASGCKK
jgi:hypothetical protein